MADKASPLVFMDTETLGLDKTAPIWEFAAVRRNLDGTEEEYHWFLDHTVYRSGRRKWTDDMPKQFLDDYQERYVAGEAIHVGDLVDTILPHVYRDRAHNVGAVPNFDTERLGLLCQRFGKPEPWHYHLIDIENIIVGCFAGMGAGLNGGPWNSDDLSRALGVDPDAFPRHTAMGDVRWEMAQWDAVKAIGDCAPSPEYMPGLKEVLGDVVWAARQFRRGNLTWRDIPHELRDLWYGYEA